MATGSRHSKEQDSGITGMAYCPEFDSTEMHKMILPGVDLSRKRPDGPPVEDWRDGLISMVTLHLNNKDITLPEAKSKILYSAHFQALLSLHGIQETITTMDRLIDYFQQHPYLLREQ